MNRPFASRQPLFEESSGLKLRKTDPDSGLFVCDADWKPGKLLQLFWLKTLALVQANRVDPDRHEHPFIPTLVNTAYYWKIRPFATSA
jgi:hypothetical protein